MSPRRGGLALASGLLAGLLATQIQACFPGCGDVEPLIGGDFVRESFYGEIFPHPQRHEVRIRIDLPRDELRVSFDTPDGRVEETWVLGAIERF